MVYAKAIKEYNDLQLKKIVTPKDEPFEVTEERAKQLEAAGVAVVVESKPAESVTVTEETPDAVPPKKTTTKKKAKKGDA